MTSKKYARRRWTRAEVAIVRREYPHRRTLDIARALRRTERSVYQQAGAMGLRKSAAFLASDASGRLSALSASGIAHRFPAGHRPWNAGLKGWNAGGRSVATRFRKGNRPQTWVPVGSERISKDGMLERKVTDKGPARWHFKPVTRIVWERHRGRIPRGHAVVFKPGRRTVERRKITIGALELVSRAQLMGRNTIHRYPSELKAVMRMAGRLRREIEART